MSYTRERVKHEWKSAARTEAGVRLNCSLRVGRDGNDVGKTDNMFWVLSRSDDKESTIKELLQIDALRNKTDVRATIETTNTINDTLRINEN